MIAAKDNRSEVRQRAVRSTEEKIREMITVRLPITGCRVQYSRTTQEYTLVVLDLCHGGYLITVLCGSHEGTHAHKRVLDLRVCQMSVRMMKLVKLSLPPKPANYYN